MTIAIQTKQIKVDSPMSIRRFPKRNFDQKNISMLHRECICYIQFGDTRNLKNAYIISNPENTYMYVPI